MIDIHGHYKVSCDHPNCNSSVNYSGYSIPFVEDLYNQGWEAKLIDSRKWYCPRHVGDHMCNDTNPFL